MRTFYSSNLRRLVERRVTFFLVLFTGVVMCALQYQQSFGQWSHDPAVNTAISTAANNQTYPAITSDGSGGAIITWQDLRSGTSIDIYAQRINASGAVQRTGDGVPISQAASNQSYSVITSDGSGGAIIAWQDSRSGTSYDIYAQRINASGVVQWTADGVPISIASNDQLYPAIASDGSGGAIITWQDGRSGTSYDIYAQRINASGAVQWTGDGATISLAANGQYNPLITSDGSGGAIITWYDNRSGTSDDIYAQRINASGAVQWTGDGVPISLAASHQYSPAITSDGSGGAIITWYDYRNGTNSDIYAQRVDRIGSLGKNEPILTAVRDVPGDQGGKVSIGWNRSSYDEFPNQVVTYYSIWRGAGPSALNGSAKPITPAEMTLNFSGKAYRTIDEAAGPTYWEWVGNLTSHYLANYAFTAPTLADSGPTGTHTAKFFVSAQTNNQFVFWDSNIDSAHSVDNLPPGAVPSLIAQLQPGPSVLLHWPPDKIDPDVGYYEVHRSTSSNFVPAPGTRIGRTSDTMSVDNGPVAGATNYYLIVTVDVHGNLSPPSPQASAGVQTTQQYSLADKWNMVSVPLTVNDYSKTSVFPSAISNAFAYQGSYVIRSVLANGAGYWLRFNGTQTVTMAGYLRSRDTVNVSTGWNMIGSISQSIPVSQVTSIPGGIATSHFFGYQGAYFISTTIEAEKAYWVKVNQDGKLVLSSSASETVDKIRIVPTGETPPPAPDGSGSENGGVPAEYALGQNYPNPFNPLAMITYQLPVGGRVTLKVFDMLGREVATLAEGEKNAGTYHAAWDAGAAPSGVYYYVLSAGSYNQIRKMVLAK